jgi:hypothetical protein
MADPWQSLNGDDGAAAAGPRGLEHFTGPERAPAGTPGLAGHRALAALAAELAEAAAGDEAGTDAPDAREPERDDSPENQVDSPADPPAGIPKPRLLARLPLPGGPSGMRLSDTGGNGGAGGASQSTITLRRRPVSDLPVSEESAPAPAPAPADPATEAPTAAPLVATAPNLTSVEAWSAHEDDILPRRQVRRTRRMWRRR